MNWEEGRPEGFNSEEIVDRILVGRFNTGKTASQALVEAGADAMHKADLEFLREFPDVIQRMQASMTKQQWFDFVAKEK